MERIESLEKAMANFMGKTQKHMEDNKIQVEKLTETVIQSGPKSPRLPLLQRPAPETLAESPTTKKRKYEESRGILQQPPAASQIVQQQYSSVVSGVTALSSQQQDQIRSMQQLMNSQQKKVQQQPPRQQRNICYGTAKPSGDSSSQTMLAADVSLVASGLDKECDEQKLRVFLEEKGLHPVDIEMMKKQDHNETEAKTWRTKSFKVTVKAGEHETALKPEIWPYRVAVRYWRAERRPRTGGWDRQARTSGGQFGVGGQSGGGQFGGQQQGRSRQDSQGWQQQQPQGRGGSAGGGLQQEQPLEISNRFASLLPQINISTVLDPSA